MNAPIALDGPRLYAALAKLPRRHGLLLDGAWRDAADGRTLSRSSPAQGVTVSTYARAGATGSGDRRCPSRLRRWPLAAHDGCWALEASARRRGPDRARRGTAGDPRRARRRQADRAGPGGDRGRGRYLALRGGTRPRPARRVLWH